jgi:hypothetical protein
MAVLEQLVFGFRADGDQRRSVLGQSSGITAECVAEIVRFCEGWGAAPVDGVRRPLLLSFPLVTRLPALPGDLYAVIRVAEGLKPIHHALVLNREGYQEFDLNPYALAQEAVFQSAWDEKSNLASLEVRPESLSPLVSPPPGPADLGNIDEAVRQMLANQRLLLPLERSSSDSDRFLALTVACLPRVLRQDLRFAAWAPSGTNRYSLAATYRESALFSSWQPYLMTSILGDLNPTCEEYLAEIRRCLRDGDLAGLERVSAKSRIELGRVGTATGRGAKPRTLTATVSERSARTVKLQVAPGPRRAVHDRGAVASAGSPPPPRRATRSAGAPSASAGHRTRRLRRAPRQTWRRGLALLISVLLLGVGAYHLTASSWFAELLIPGEPVDLSLRIDPRHDVVDVGHLYRRIVQPAQQAGTTALVHLDKNHRRRSLEALQQAGVVLAQQGDDYLQATARFLDDPAATGDPTLDPDRLLARGRRLSSEWRRLALAQFALQELVAWDDLAAMSAGGLQARLDSLLGSRQRQGALEPGLLAVRERLVGVTQRTRQLGGLVELEQLLAAPRWEHGWEARCEAAIEKLSGVAQRRARQLRDDAFLLIRLKRAEHATGLAELALIDHYGPAATVTPAVADILTDVLARVTDAAAVECPALLRATAAYYTGLARATAPEAPAELILAVSDELAENRAVHFDPAVYGGHVARLRFMLLEQLLAAGTPPDALPEACFGDGPADEHLAFVTLQRLEPEPASWRALADTLTDPYLIRWARFRSREVDTITAR